MGEDGKRKWVRQSLSFPETMPAADQRHAAEVALARLVIDIEDGKMAAGKPQTLRDLAALWMDNHVQANCEPDTVKTYRNFLDKRILPMIGDTPLNQITPLMMSTYLAKLRNEPVVSQALPEDALKRKRTPSDAAKLAKNKKRCFLRAPFAIITIPLVPCSNRRCGGS